MKSKLISVGVRGELQGMISHWKEMIFYIGGDIDLRTKNRIQTAIKCLENAERATAFLDTGSSQKLRRLGNKLMRKAQGKIVLNFPLS